jgi:hypothetical protein
MRMLIHYVGDAHQPLHGETRLDKNYPTGDRGGNDFNLPSHYGAKELHAVWDKVMYEFHVIAKLPFSEDTFQTFDESVSSLMSKWPVSKLADVTDLQPEHWENESFQIVQDFTYVGIKEGEALPDSYVAKGTPILERQIVTAGHRLANIL